MLLMDCEDTPPPVVIISVTLDLVGQYTAEKEIHTDDIFCSAKSFFIKAMLYCRCIAV